MTRFSAKFVAGSLFLAGLVSAISAVNAEPAHNSGSPPWEISDGQSGSGPYVPRHILKIYEKGTRSRDGKPGPNYWQNQAVHRTPSAWQANGRSTEVIISNSKALSAITLDSGIFVDFNPADNKWKQ